MHSTGNPETTAGCEIRDFTGLGLPEVDPHGAPLTNPVIREVRSRERVRQGGRSEAQSSGRRQTMTYNSSREGSGAILLLRLCSVSVLGKAQSENVVFSIARTRCRETQYSLFPIYCRLPKLDVAGSTRQIPSQLNCAALVMLLGARNVAHWSKTVPKVQL